MHVLDWLKIIFNQEDAAKRGRCLPIPEAAGLSLEAFCLALGRPIQAAWKNHLKSN